MTWTWTPLMLGLAIVWGIFTVGLIILLIYRSTLTMHEDEALYLDEASAHMQAGADGTAGEGQPAHHPGVGFRRRFRSTAAGAGRYVHLSGIERRTIARSRIARRPRRQAAGRQFADHWVSVSGVSVSALRCVTPCPEPALSRAEGWLKILSPLRYSSSRARTSLIVLLSLSCKLAWCAPFSNRSRC